MPNRLRFKSLIKLSLIVLAGGYIFQSNPNAACVRIGMDQTLTAINACFVFDCQNGILGGLINPCVPGQEIFVDCNIP
jgi:ABC-type xylose transport system permease subunit